MPKNSPLVVPHYFCVVVLIAFTSSAVRFRLEFWFFFRLYIRKKLTDFGQNLLNHCWCAKKRTPWHGTASICARSRLLKGCVKVFVEIPGCIFQRDNVRSGKVTKFMSYEGRKKFQD